MNRGDMTTAIKCIGNSTVDNLPDILEPFSKYGKSVGILIKSIRDGVANG